MTPFINGWTREKVIEHIKANFKGRSTLGSNTACAYRGEGGRKCAVGLFIPDEIYDESMEVNLPSLYFKHPEVLEHMPLSYEHMGQLQDIHDGGWRDDEILGSMLAYVEGL